MAKQRKKAADARASAGRSKSESTIRTRLREADRADVEANKAEQARARAESKAADLEKTISKALADVEKRRADDQRRALRNIERDSRLARSQFTQGFDMPASHPFGATAAAGTTEEVPAHDVFLSHASEDKDDIARPLYDALTARGVTVWFDEIEITVGKSIRQEIEKNIARARFGIVILSPDFLKKQWTQTELDALFSRKMNSGEDLVLPIWHKITKQEVLDQSTLLAGIHALNSAIQTVDEMADLLAKAVEPDTSA